MLRCPRGFHSVLALLVSTFIAMTLPTDGPAQESANRPDLTMAWVTDVVKAPRVEFHTFESKTVGAIVSYHAYTPPAYNTNADRRFPVLYWLHGTDGVRPLAKHFNDAI